MAENMVDAGEEELIDFRTDVIKRGRPVFAQPCKGFSAYQWFSRELRCTCCERADEHFLNRNLMADRLRNRDQRLAARKYQRAAPELFRLRDIGSCVEIDQITGRPMGLQAGFCFVGMRKHRPRCKEY